MAGLCEGRMGVVTGAGRGIGRAHARLVATHGARVVVNDIGGELDGEGQSATPAQEVVDQIAAAGGDAVANADDCADFEGARRLVATAVERWGRLDAVVAN